MLLLFRIALTALFVWTVIRARDGAHANLADDLGNAWNIAMVVISGIAMSVTWAPLLGSTVADPITGIMTDGSVMEFNNPLLRLIRRAERRGHRRLVMLLCFVEGVRHPRLPAQFIMGMNNAPPGSWLEKVFAREVYRFSNVANAAKAREILRDRHDADPGPHERVEVNLALLSDVRTVRPAPEEGAVPAAPPPPPLARNPNIRLFAGADSAGRTSTDTSNPNP